MFFLEFRAGYREYFSPGAMETNILVPYAKDISPGQKASFTNTVPLRGRGSLIITLAFYWHGMTFMSACISNYIHYTLWYEIAYPFINFDSATDEV